MCIGKSAENKTKQKKVAAAAKSYSPLFQYLVLHFQYHKRSKSLIYLSMKRTASNITIPRCLKVWMHHQKVLRLV